MSISRINIKVSSTWTTSTSTTYSSGTQNHTAGNTLIVCVGGGAGGGESVTGITDTAGNTYTKVDHNIGTDLYREEIWYAKNIIGHATNNVTVTWSSAVNYRGIVVLQYAGLSITSPYVTTAKGIASTSSTIVTTGTFTTSAFEEVRILIPRWGLYTVDTMSYPSDFTEISPSTNTLVGELFGYSLITGGTYSINHSNTTNNKQILLAVFTSGVIPVPPDVRITQDVIETLSLPINPALRVTQDVIETLSQPINVSIRTTQYVVELLSTSVSTAPVSTETTQFVIIM